MKILIRADSGRHIGTGHVMRTMTLAHKFKSLGHSVTYLTRDHDLNISDFIARDFEVIKLHGGVHGAFLDDGNYERWLGVSVDDEIRECKEAILGRDFDLLIVDHYGLDERFERAMNVPTVFVIDDLCNRPHAAQFLLDQNLHGNDVLAAYERLNKCKTCTYFLGPKFALLKDAFKDHHPSAKKITAVKNALVYFGGTDPTGECKKVVDCSTGEFKLHVILSENHPDFLDLKKRSDIALYPFVDDMAGLMSRMDVCFGAGGATTWERMCVGLPTFIAIVADNQSILKDAVKTYKFASIVENSAWDQAFTKCRDLSLLNDMIAKGLELSDGRGVERIISKITL